MPGVGVVMVSSIACATFATWKRAAGIREPSHHARHAQMRPARLLLRAGSRLVVRAGSLPPVSEREHAGSVLRLRRRVIGGQVEGGSPSRRESPSWGSAPDAVAASVLRSPAQSGAGTVTARARGEALHTGVGEAQNGSFVKRPTIRLSGIPAMCWGRAAAGERTVDRMVSGRSIPPQLWPSRYWTRRIANPTGLGGERISFAGSRSKRVHVTGWRGRLSGVRPFPGRRSRAP
jgi:hypothetical protein